MAIIKLAQLEKVNPSLLQIAKDFIEQVENGEISCALIASVLTDGTTRDAFSESHCSATMVGAIEASKHHFIQHWLEH